MTSSIDKPEHIAYFWKCPNFREPYSIVIITSKYEVTRRVATDNPQILWRISFKRWKGIQSNGKIQFKNGFRRIFTTLFTFDSYFPNPRPVMNFVTSHTSPLWCWVAIQVNEQNGMILSLIRETVVGSQRAEGADRLFFFFFFYSQARLTHTFVYTVQSISYFELQWFSQSPMLASYL